MAMGKKTKAQRNLLFFRQSASYTLRGRRQQQVESSRVERACSIREAFFGKAMGIFNGRPVSTFGDDSRQKPPLGRLRWRYTFNKTLKFLYGATTIFFKKVTKCPKLKKFHPGNFASKKIRE